LSPNHFDNHQATLYPRLVKLFIVLQIGKWYAAFFDISLSTGIR
jgi:hypothetical protein